MAEMDHRELLREISEMLDERFAAQDQEIDRKLDERFAAQDREIDRKLDERFAAYDKKMDERFDAYDKKMDERFTSFKKELLKESAAQSMVLMESFFQPQFNLLSEKMDQLLERVAPMEAVLELEDRMDTVEKDVEDLTRRVEKLEEAV